MKDSWWNRPVLKIGEYFEMTPLNIELGLVGGALGIAVAITQEDFFRSYGLAWSDCVRSGMCW